VPIQRGERHLVTIEEVTVLIPNYRTPEITVLCLRLLRKHTDPSKVLVIVIDNNSNDQSLEYLRGLRWIRLIERVPQADESGPLSHARALDEGVSHVQTPYFIVLHSDTFVKRRDWIDALLKPMKHDSNLGGVGSWKLGTLSLAGLAKQWLQESFPFWKHREAPIRYLRSHCAIYRTDLVMKHGLKFAERGECWPAGKILHDRLVSLGYSVQFLSPQFLSAYITHLEHATMVLNPDLGASHRTIVKGVARIKRVFKELNADQILGDASLDV